MKTAEGADLMDRRMIPETQAERDVLTAFIHREMAGWRVAEPDLPAEWMQDGPMDADGIMPIVILAGEPQDLASELMGGPPAGPPRDAIRARAWVREGNHDQAEVAWQVDASPYTFAQSNVAGYGPFLSRPSTQGTEK